MTESDVATGAYTNTLGMRFVRIPPGAFLMGQADGDGDERPVHRVTLSAGFAMAATPVTNAQYEQFDPAHRALRGRNGLAREDDEAVVFVSWHQAVAFCAWLSAREGKAYRLPTEAEWEYACRAGTATPFHTGDTLPEVYHRHQQSEWFPVAVPLHVGRTPPNAWGLHDLHGLVEEWCHDWYGPYAATDQTDPIGAAGGLFRVTRGGSHNTEVPFLRAANRLGTLPEDRHWLIGFRPVLGPLPASPPLPEAPSPAWAVHVTRDVAPWPPPGAPDAPCFAGPLRFVHVPPDPAAVPMYPHNHCPSIAWCDNGDLLAVWFSCRTERGREMTILASRLRRGASAWDLPSEFFKAPDRNMTGSALLNDGRGTLYHVNGLEAAGRWANLAVVLRTSTDHGATWSPPRLIAPEHQPHNQVISGTSVTREGWLIQPCDAVYKGDGGTALHISRDGGRTWVDPGAGAPAPDFASADSGGLIAGIHAGVVQLRNGRLLAFGRGDNRRAADSAGGECMPCSVSADMGRTWHYSASEFPPIAGGQRLVLLRLREGPLLLASFTDSSARRQHPDWPCIEGMDMLDAAGARRRCYGLFAALSFDEGRTWPQRRLVAPGSGSRVLDGGAWTGAFTLDVTRAEPLGYLAATQSPDGVIHLVSSAWHYRFNLAWLRQSAPRP